MSATLKDNVLYVFSSNAAPFEPNQAYSPFAVYTLLEHGGDWERAARRASRPKATAAMSPTTRVWT